MADPQLSRGRSPRRPVHVLGVEPRRLEDPGNAGRITVVEAAAYVLIVTGAGAETRLLTDPIFEGQVLDLIFETDLGDCVITADSAVNQTGNTIMTFADGGDHLRLIGARDGAGDFEWRVIVNDGITLG